MQRFLFSILLVLGVAFSLQGKNKKSDSTEVKQPVFSGVFVNVDVLSPAGVLIDDQLRAELSVDVGLKEIFYPIIEVGYAKYLNLNLPAYDFDINGYYSRVGLNLNLSKVVNINGGDVLIGLRYAMSFYDYSYSNVAITNEFWNTEFTCDKSDRYHGMAGWMELMLGFRVNIVKNFYMGWSVRGRLLPFKVEKNPIKSCAVSGFGYGTASWGVSYNLSYRFGGNGNSNKKKNKNTE